MTIITDTCLKTLEFEGLYLDWCNYGAKINRSLFRRLLFCVLNKRFDINS